MLLPLCEACMEHTPAANNTALLLETVHTALLSVVKTTGKPELATALRVKDAPSAWVAMVLKTMVCACRLIAKLCETGVAAAKILFPACEATIVQIPVPVSAAVLLETVQTVGVADVKATDKPELAVALNGRDTPSV